MSQAFPICYGGKKAKDPLRYPPSEAVPFCCQKSRCRSNFYAAAGTDGGIDALYKSGPEWKQQNKTFEP